MTLLVDDLANEAELVSQITAVAAQNICPDFGDLWWDKVDLDSIFSNPGVIFETYSRRFVIAFINGELRYYAGGTDIYADEYSYELGVFGSLRGALEFAKKYLTEGRELGEIDNQRAVRSSG